MMRVVLLILLCLLLTGCTADDPLAAMAGPVDATPSDIPGPFAQEPSLERQSATLWFRFGSEALLAPETRQITVSPTAPSELSLLHALVGGPAASSAELSGLFPPGTRVLSTHRQGRMLFVTLSRHIMDDFPDEPDAWQSLPEWAAEVPLRRSLAMQAIAATITENCDVDQVVILVEQTAQFTDSLRLRQSYYRTGAPANTLAAPLVRDESHLLTHSTTADIILQCWSGRDWSRLYPYIARRDPATGLERPDYETFAAQMNALPHLTDYRFSSGSISPDGSQAVFTLDADFLVDGQELSLDGILIRLYRERCIWRIGLSQLTGREVIRP